MLPEFVAEQLALWICSCARFRLAIEKVTRCSFAFIGRRGLIFFSAGSAAQVIERNVSHNPVQPSIEAALKSKAVQISVNPEKAFLINVAGIFTAVDQVQRQTQNFAIVAADEFLEGQTVSGLRLANEGMFVRNLHSCVARISLESDAHPQSVTHRLRRVVVSARRDCSRFATDPVTRLSS